jgi:hypothetical protein
MWQSALPPGLCATGVGVAGSSMMGALLTAGLTPAQQDGEAFAGLLCSIIVPIVLLIIWIRVAVWVYRDARSRGLEATMWLLITLLAGIIGLIIYLVVRNQPQHRLMPQYPPPGYAYPPPPPPQGAYQNPYYGQQQYVVEDYYVDEYGRRVPPPPPQ